MPASKNPTGFSRGSVKCKKCGNNAENRGGIIVCKKCGDNQDKCRCKFKYSIFDVVDGGSR